MTKDLPALRLLVRQQMLDNGGGLIAQTMTDAAQSIGLDQPHLSQFLNGRIDCSIEMALRLAPFLRMHRNDVLTLAGHEDIIPLLSDDDDGGNGGPISPAAQQIDKLIKPLSASQQQDLVASLRAQLKLVTPVKPQRKP